MIWRIAGMSVPDTRDFSIKFARRGNLSSVTVVGATRLISITARACVKWFKQIFTRVINFNSSSRVPASTGIDQLISPSRRKKKKNSKIPRVFVFPRLWRRKKLSRRFPNKYRPTLRFYVNTDFARAVQTKSLSNTDGVLMRMFALIIRSSNLPTKSKASTMAAIFSLLIILSVSIYSFFHPQNYLSSSDQLRTNIINFLLSFLKKFPHSIKYKVKKTKKVNKEIFQRSSLFTFENERLKKLGKKEWN